MSASFPTELRSRGGAITIGSPMDETIGFRVQVLEAWDTVQVKAPSDTPVSVVKARALGAIVPSGHSEDYVAKVGGWEVLDESASLASSGVVDGSTLLLMLRRRRPVR